MLFISDEEYRRLADMMEETQTGDPEEAARRVIQARPTFAPGWIVLGASAKDPQEALAAFWKALWLEPCRAQNYLALADFLSQRQEANAIAKHLRTLALWKLSFADQIPKYIGEMFEGSMGEEAWDPSTYELMAMAQEAEFAKSAEIPAITDRLRPYRLLNQLQSGAPEYLPPGVLKAILEHRDLCEPLLRNALREWGRIEEALDEDSVSLLVAILGEISGPEFIEELLELSSWPDFAPFAHAQWALYRQGQRHSQAALEQYRRAVSGPLPTRGCIAEQILAMEPQPGDIDVLVSLLEGSESFPLDEDVPQFLAAVLSGIARRGGRELAASLASRYGQRLSESDRKKLDDALRGNYTPLLNALEIAGHTLEDVCLQRTLLGPPEEPEELTEDEMEEEVDLEPPPRPGRNEPCWCGSGKKYKKCHMTADEDAARTKSAEPPDTSESLHTKLMHRVFEASREWHRESDLKRAKKMYFGESGKVEATEEEINGFIQWLLHDFRDAATHRTAIENFLRTRDAKLSPAERELLESLRDARFGLFEVTRVEPGSGVQLRDIFMGDSRFVDDISSSNSLHRWDCLLVRLQFLEGRWIMAGDGMTVPRNTLATLLEFIERESRKPKQGAAEFVRANSHQLHRVAGDLFQRDLAGLRVVNAEGEEVSIGKAEYQVSDEAALLAKLRPLEELEEDAADAGPLGFTWLQPMGGERRPFGHLEIEGGKLRLEAMSRTRLETLRGLVEFHAGNLLKHLGDQYTSIDDIKERVLRGEPAPEPKNQRPLSAEEREALEQLMHKHYAGWVNEKIPALGGKTPRQAMRSRAGRESVIELLRLMENKELRKDQQAQPTYDFNIIRRELGLPEE
jgi:hypothetical protein